MKKLKHILMVSVLLSAGITSPADGQTPELIYDNEFRSVAPVAIDSIYNFKFDAGREMLKPWRNRHPDHPVWILIDGLIVWWDVLSDTEDRSHDERFYDLMSKADYESLKLLRKNNSHVDALVVRAVSNGYLSRFFSYRDQFTSQINHARKAYNAYSYLIEVAPGLIDLKLAGGLILYYAAHLAEEYPIINVAWFFPKGDKQEGLKQMRAAADSAIFARPKALFYLGHVNYSYEENLERAASYYEKLYEKYPHNNYYVREIVQNYHSMERYDDALKVIEESIERWEIYDLPYYNVLVEEIITLKGQILIEKERYEEAASALKKAYNTGKKLPNTENREMHMWSGYHLGNALHHLGRNEEAASYLEKVAGMKAKPDVRKLAEDLLKEINNK